MKQKPPISFRPTKETEKKLKKLIIKSKLNRNQIINLALNKLRV